MTAETSGLVCGHRHLYSTLARGMPAPPMAPAAASRRTIDSSAVAVAASSVCTRRSRATTRPPRQPPGWLVITAWAHIPVAEAADDRAAGQRLASLAQHDWLLAHCAHLDRDLPGTIAHNPRSNMNNGVGYARPAAR